MVVAALSGLLAGPASGASGGAGLHGGSGHGGTHRGHPAAGGSRNPFARRAMWIWELERSDGGDLSSIIATAHRYGVSAVFVKSGDGSSTWSQFDSQLVSTLHSGGLRVCGWQYVYGKHPVNEAQVGAAAVSGGADCLLIDAESEYEGRYVQAQTYIRQLRRLIGASFPVALAGFPYVDYHPAFPYSVFLGPGGAQFNVPQMYWFDIGTSADTVYGHTYSYNLPYQRQIFPLGQVSGNPPAAQIRRFRQLSRAYGAGGVSWWDWQDAGARSWHALSQSVASLNFSAYPAMAKIKRGSSGDLVVWAQEHLYSAGFRTTIDGGFGPHTLSAVRSFQRTHGLSADGVIGQLTWAALLRYPPARVTWTSGGARAASAAGAGLTLSLPKSARLRARRYEIPPHLGAGRGPG